LALSAELKISPVKLKSHAKTLLSHQWVVGHISTPNQVIQLGNIAPGEQRLTNLFVEVLKHGYLDIPKKT
jgi:hypothetical protein